MSRTAAKRLRTARPPEPVSMDAHEIQEVQQRVNLALNAIRWIRWHSAGLVHAADELHQSRRCQAACAGWAPRRGETEEGADVSRHRPSLEIDAEQLVAGTRLRLQEADL